MNQDLDFDTCQINFERKKICYLLSKFENGKSIHTNYGILRVFLSEMPCKKHKIHYLKECREFELLIRPITTENGESSS